MATLYRVDGTTLEVTPPAGRRKFKLSEVQEIIGGYVQAVQLPKVKGVPTRTVLCDEDGIGKRLPINVNFHQTCVPWGLCGDVLVVGRGEF